MTCGALLAVAFALIGAAPAAARDDTGAKLIACAPTTFDAAVQCLHDDLPARMRADLLAPGGAIRAHMGLGLFLRNNWGLWQHGPLAASLIAQGFRHPDDMTGAIFDAYVAREKGQSFDLRRQIADYAAYWDKQAKQ